MTSSEVTGTTPEFRERDDPKIENFNASEVQNTYPKEGVCLLKNAPGVDYCHCIPRAFMKSQKGIVCVYRIQYL
jgi:hypothetical protein